MLTLYISKTFRRGKNFNPPNRKSRLENRIENSSPTLMFCCQTQCQCWAAWNSPRGVNSESKKKNTSEKTNKKKSRWSDMEQRSMSVNYKFFSFCSEHRACEAIKSLTNILTSAVWWSLQLTQHVLRDNETAQWSSFTCLTRSLAKAKHRLQKRKSFNAVGWKAQKPKIHHVINFSSFAGGLRIDGKIRFSKTDFFFCCLESRRAQRIEIGLRCPKWNGRARDAVTYVEVEYLIAN